MFILIKPLQTAEHDKLMVRMWRHFTTLYVSMHITFLFLLTCVLYVQAQKLPKANAVSVLQAPSLRIQPAPSAAAYDPKIADLRLYGAAHFDPSKRKTNTGKRYHYLQQQASSPYGRIYDSNTKRYEASPSKISYEIKVYIPKHEPDYPAKPTYEPTYEEMPPPEYPTIYEERPVYSYSPPSPKYEQRVSYMKPYYTPEGKTMYEVRPGYSSGRPYRQPSYEVPYKPMYEMEYRKPVYDMEYKPPPPVYKQQSYEVYYKPAQPVYEEPQYKQPTYEVAYKPTYREYEPPPPPPPPAYPPSYEPKSKPEGYSQTIPYDQQQTTYQMDSYRPKQESYENKGGQYGYQKPSPQMPIYQPQQQSVYQESSPNYYQPQQAPQYQPPSPPMHYQIQVSPPQPNYPSYGYGTYANYR